MMKAAAGIWKRSGKRALRILLCVMLVLQTLWIPNSALAATAFYFRGFGSENVTSYTFQYATIGANVSGTTVTMQPTADEGTAVGLVTLDEEEHDISTSVDLGGLEISFSTLTTVTLEGDGGSENDIPSVDISFCSAPDTGSEISSVHLQKPDSTVSGSVTLSSGAHIPSGTRAIFIYLNGTSTTGSNTVVFSNTSFVIRDAAAPSCDVSYEQNWTNEDITVTISAEDGDSGLEGIYFNGERVTQTSPYTFVVTENNTSFTAYSMDYAGKQSEVRNVTVANIDKTTPDAPASVPLSSTSWSNTDVSVLMPALGESGGAPERYVYQIGASDWADLPDGFAIGAEGDTTIRVAVEDAAGNRSSYAEATARIDKQAPVIGEPSTSVGSGSVRVDVSVTDEGSSGIDRFLYAEGEQGADYFSTGGTAITDNSFTVAVGGTYTIFASDHAGNTALRTTALSTAPSIDSVADMTIDEDETRNVPLTVSDAESGLDELTISVSTTDDTLLETVTINQSSEAASLDITPAANRSGGPVTVTVTVEDPSGETASIQFNVTVNPVNDPPAAQNDTGITLEEDGVVLIDVLANDTDTADGDTLSITNAGTPAHGATMIVLGKIRYTPDADYAGEDSFTYTISDGHGGTDTATVAITVTNVNDAPVAAGDAAETQEDFAVTIPVLDNDTDADVGYNPLEQISIVSSTDGANGTTEITEDGICYTPATNFNGADTFTYTIRDEAGLTSEASVTVTVGPEADDPWFSGLSDEYTMNEDAQGYEISFKIYDVETPADSLMLQAASLDEGMIEQSGIEITGLGDGEPDVSILLSPVADQNGDVEITLTLGDGFTNVEKTITIHVDNVNDAPRVTNDTVEYAEDTEYVDISIAGLLANDRDIEGDSIHFGGIETYASVGTIEQLNETTLRYTPAVDYDGTDSFTFSVSDGSASAVSTCTLKAIGVNDPPVITVDNDTYAATEDTLAVIPFTIGDNESSPADLSVIAASSDDSIVTTDGITIVNNGDGTGEVRIQPQDDANGSVTISLTVSDGEAQGQDAFTLNVGAAQDAPVAVDDKIYVRYCTSRTFTVLVNDHDVDGDPLSVLSFSEDLPGTLTFDEETQTFTYQPAIGENGTYTFTYVMTDGTDTASATVTLYVATIAHNPVITAINSQYVNEDSTISGITFNVSDEDAGDTATVSVSSGNTGLLPEDGEHIQVTSLGNGNYSLSLTPAADQYGTVIVTVTATDSTERTDSATFTLRVLAQNDAPVAADDEYSMDEDGSLLLTPLQNDSDPDGDSIWLSTILTPAHGYILRSASGYTYYPYNDWNGTETLTYRVSDGHATAQAHMTITVNPVNDDPVARTDYQELPDEEGQYALINVLSNDYDPDGDDVYTIEIMSAPRHGSAVIETDGRITYTRTEVSGEPNGADSFTYRIIDRETDGEGTRSDVATVYIGVEFISSLHTYGRTVTCLEDADTFNIDIPVSNPNNVEYTLTINDTTTLGSFEVVDRDTVAFTPAPDQNGYASISYTVEQVGGGEQSTGTISLYVYPVNDLPQIDSAPASVTMDEDASGGYTFDVSFHDPDCSTEDLNFYVYTQNAATSAPVPFQCWYTVSRTQTGASVTIHTAANVNGTGEIVVGVSDGMDYDERTIGLTVTPVDDAPVVQAVSKTIFEDTSVCFVSPGSDSEADGDGTVDSIEPGDEPQHGTASFRANGTILYVPDKDFYGTDVFYVTITDQTDAALSSRAMVTITVEPINDQPEITRLDYYQATPEDKAKDVPITVVDVDNDLSGSEHYTLTSSDQSIVKDENISISHVSGNEMAIHIVPEENAYGVVKIDVVVSDGELTTEGAFELNVIPVNDIPIALNDTASVDEVVSTGAEPTPPATVQTIDLIANDSDVEDGKPKIVLITNAENCTVTNIGGGSVRVSVEGDYSGDVTFSYTVMDRAGATASANVVLTVNPVNDPPRARDDSITIDEDATGEISVLANDTDPEGDTLAIDGVSAPAHGNAVISGTKVLYTPDANYYGTDSFTYTVSDGNGGTASATARITIQPVNDAPTIAKHSSTAGDWSMDEDTTDSFHFVVADAESAVSALIIRITSLDESLIKTSQIALTSDASGYKIITVTPEHNVHGTVPIRIQVSDGLLTTTASYDIEIVSVNDAPLVTVPRQSVKEDTLLSATAFATDIDGDSVTFSKLTNPAHGTVSVQEDGTFDYMPNGDYNGEDSFIIAADDGHTENNVGTATVFITVQPDGDAPVATDDVINIDEDNQGLVTALENDDDADIVYGDEISILSVGSPAHGTAVESDGGILYTPETNYNGTDTFQYTIVDLDGKLDTAQVVVTINPVNDPPSGGDDTASVLEDHSVTIEVTANDDLDLTTNPELEDLTVTQVDDPAHGTAVIDEGAKSITYTPDENWFSPAGEPEVFYYTVQDDAGETARFAVSVAVTSVNDLPVLNPADLPNISTVEDTATSAVSFTVGDVETAAGSLIVTVTHNNSTLLPTVTVTPDAEGACTFTVTPKANKVGAAIFTVTVRDADGGTVTDTFTLTVTPDNDLPSAQNDAFMVSENGYSDYNVLANDDVDVLTGNGGDTLTLLTIGETQFGTATIVNNKLHYVPKADLSNKESYTDTFTYTMQDASGTQSGATVVVTVTPVNDAPAISEIADVADVEEDAPDGTGDISFTVTDEEDDDDTLAVTVTSSNTTLFPLANITVTNPTDDPTGSVRTVKAVPAADQFGTCTITLTVHDSQGLSASSAFTVTVISENDVPDNGNKSYTVVEDVEKQLDVLEGIDADYDTTPEYIEITQIVTEPSHGTVRIAADKKSLYYVTAQDSNEPDTFQYQIHDSFGDADYTFTVSITVTPVNDAPVITYLGEPGYTIFEGSSVNDIPFTVTDVDNVTYAGGEDPVEVTLSAKSSNTILLRNGIHIDTLTGNDRDIDLTPYLKWNGTTTVTITATDPGGLKSSVSFMLTVNNINDTPVAVDDDVTIQEDQTTAVYVLANDTDADLLTNPETEYIRIKTLTSEDPNATVELSQDRLRVLVTPNENYNGPVSFTYSIEDASGAVSNTASASITVAQVNDAPEVENDTAETAEDTPVDILVLENDSDIDMREGLNADPDAESIGVTIGDEGLLEPSHGSITTDGVKITYTPDEDYNGTDTFEYNCYDGDTKTTGSVTVTITQVNDAPIAVADTASTNEDTATDAIDVLANDTDVDTGTSLNQGTLHLHSDMTITEAAVRDAASGSVSIEENKLVFSPALNWFGVAIIDYTMADGHGGTSSSTLSVTVYSVNDLPLFTTAPADMELTEDSDNGESGLVVNDVETAAELLNVTIMSSDNPTLVDVGDVMIAAGAGGARTVTINPKDDQNGTAVIALKVTDGDGGETTVSFTVTVAAVNDTPVALDKTLNINEDASTLTIQKSVVSGDVDVATNADTYNLTITTPAQHGTAGVDENGNLTYTPNENYNGQDSFGYTATDAANAAGTGTITINIAQVNDAPEVENDTAETAEDTPVDILVLENDSDIDMREGLNADPDAESIGVTIGDEGLLEPSHGSITTDGAKITYTPDEDYNGTDTFEYNCYDGDTKTTGSVTVTITQVNDAPVAVADTASTNEDTATDAIDVLANDTDVDTGTSLNQGTLHLHGDMTITEAAVRDAASGSVSIEENKLVFSPALNWFGVAIIDYTMADGHGGTSSSTLSVTVYSVNDLPLFTTAPADMELTEDSDNGESGLVVNDVETAAELLNVTIMSSDNPTLVDVGDVMIAAGAGGARTVTINPKDDQNGTAVIALKVTDGDGGETTVSFTVTVAAVNDTPVALDKTLNINEDASTLTIQKSVVSGDVDVATNADTYNLTITTPAQHGTAGVDENGNLTYTPNENYNGQDSFGYTATDAANAAGTGTITINIAQVNDAPEVENDTAETAEDTPVDILVLENDSDIDMREGLNADPDAESIGVTIGDEGLLEPSHGSITTDGVKITYTPDEDYNGTDTFEYNCYDGDTKTTGSVTVTITQVNDAPIAVADSATTDEDTAVRVNVLTNDTDVDTLADLNQNALHSKDSFSIESCSISGTAHGTLEQDGAELVYDPYADFSGTQVIQYVLSDGHGGTSTGTLTIGVDSVNDAPVAADDSMSAAEDHAASVNVLTNDSDVDSGDTITFAGFTEPTSGLPGTFETTPAGDVTFTPDANYNGSFTIGYQIRDAEGLTGTADITVTITSVNDKPAAGDANVSTEEDTPKGFNVGGIIGDADILTNGDELTVSIAAGGNPLHGTASVDGTTINYTPSANFNGSDTITYTVTDKSGATDSGQLTITVHAVNDAPNALNDTKTTNEDTPVVITALANDDDVDTDETLNASPAGLPTILSVTNGAHGSATTDGETITYTPNGDYNGTDTLTYVITDGILTGEATISLTIEQVNDPIVTADDAAVTNDEETVSIDVLANDTDIDTDEELNENALHLRTSFAITSVDTPAHGTASIVSGKIEYTPKDGFAGEDSFGYTVSDGYGSTGNATVRVSVRSVNDPPETPVVTKPEDGDRTGTNGTVTIIWSGFDIDGDALTYRLEYFNGTTWELIADELTDTAYEFAIPDSMASTSGLKFRVNASDSEFTSDYGYSGAMVVDKDAPVGTIVTLRTADGRTYKAGTWTNQTVTVVASSAQDVSSVTYYYSMDGGESQPGTGVDVTIGVHTVGITSKDEFGNAAVVGSYLVRVDKLQPATPTIRESANSSGVVLTFVLQADPGGSGNDRLVMPDGTVVNAEGSLTWTAAKNGTYSFTIYDAVGNKRTFTHTITSADTSEPVIGIDTGTYQIGTETTEPVTAMLTFTDAQSDIVSSGCQVSVSSTASGAYQTYSGALKLSDPGTYYIHAYAKNAFGLSAYETFGPFIIEIAATADKTLASEPTPTPEPETGDVVVTKEDVEEVPGDTVYIRLPGQEWGETLTLTDIGPGTYLIEVMDENGNIRTVEIHVTMQDIFARSLRSAADRISPAAAAFIALMALLILLLALLASCNVTVSVMGEKKGKERKLRVFRHIRRRKEELIVKLDGRRLTSGEYAVLRLARRFSKRMRGNTVVVTMQGGELLREQIPLDMDEAFIREINIPK